MKDWKTLWCSGIRLCDSSQWKAHGNVPHHNLLYGPSASSWPRLFYFIFDIKHQNKKIKNFLFFSHLWLTFKWTTFELNKQNHRITTKDVCNHNTLHCPLISCVKVCWNGPQSFVRFSPCWEQHIWEESTCMGRQNKEQKGRDTESKGKRKPCHFCRQSHCDVP